MRNMDNDVCRVLAGAVFAPLVLFLTTAPAARATTNAVPNLSFESPMLQPGANNNGGNGDTTAIPGWTITAPSSSGINNGIYHPIGGFTTTNPLPPPADANQIAYLFPGNTGATSSITTTSSVSSIAANTTYMLTVALGNRNDNLFFDTGLYTIDLLANGVSVAENTLAGSAVPRGSFVDLSTSFLSNPTLMGESLTIRLSATAGTPNDEGIFDNVRLTATTTGPVSVPDPANTAVLLGFAAVALAVVRARTGGAQGSPSFLN